MPFIKTISYAAADKVLKKLYDRVTGPDNNIDNIMMIHSLRPHTMVGHMSLYKNTLHHSNNTLPKWFLETIGIYVSILNNCSYCVEHHYEGLKRLLADDDRAKVIKKKLITNSFETLFDTNYFLVLRYAEILTREPDKVSENQINELKKSGLDDGQILEVNQVISYFNYANRTVLGLGVNVKGDILGLSPNDSDDEKNWNHK
tara:strand:- start:481879 stop:482484 length:606 start_codon:yes stop_codon:yes gene_type:complete